MGPTHSFSGGTLFFWLSPATSVSFSFLSFIYLSFYTFSPSSCLILSSSPSSSASFEPWVSGFIAPPSPPLFSLQEQQHYPCPMLFGNSPGEVDVEPAVLLRGTARAFPLQPSSQTTSLVKTQVVDTEPGSVSHISLGAQSL